MMSFNNLAIELFVPKVGTWTLVAYIGVCIILGIGFLVGLTMVPARYRKKLVVGLTFVLGFVYFIEFMFPGKDLAPIRSEMKAAQNSLDIAHQDLYAVAIGRGSKSERIGHAERAIDKALSHLDKADKLIGARLPDAMNKADRASAEAKNWAKKHYLPDRCFEKDSAGRIDDVKTKPLKKRVDDLKDTAGTIAGVSAMLREVRGSLGTAGNKEINVNRTKISSAANAVGSTSATLADNFLSPYMQPLATTTMVIGSFALVLGIYSLATVHGKAVVRRRPGWSSSLAFFIALITMIVVAFLQDYLGSGTGKSISRTIYLVLFDGALKALSATMFSLVAFYIVSAAYRAFRIKSAESALMMAAAFIIMLALVPFGAMLTNNLPTHGWMQVLRLEKIGTWILNYPNAAAQRGMQFGIGVGALAMAIRIWLSLERGSYFDKQM